MNTADKVLDALGSHKLKRSGDNEYRANRPWSIGSDSQGLSLKIDGPEHGTWHDFVDDTSGSLYELAARLGIDTPKRGEVQSTKRVYRDIADYAAAHGVGVEVLTSAGWHQTTHINRPAIAIPTRNGTRYRFLDDGKPTYINPKGYSACWYGLQRAIETARLLDMPLVLCNGEASTVVAQHYGLPAFAQTSGEKRLPDALTSELRGLWQGQVWIALDCDNTGVKAANAIADQLSDSVVVDLQLGDGGDLADFCMLHTDQVKSALFKLAGVAQDQQRASKGVDARDVMDVLISRIEIDTAPKGLPVVFPFPGFHKLQGIARVLMPGKITGLIAPSGAGKTSFLETFADELNKRGYSGFWCGPEWTPEEYGRRRIQRYGGPDLTVQAMYELWKAERRDGVPDNLRHGVSLSTNQEIELVKIANHVKQWPGTMYYFDQRTSLEAMLDDMQDRLEDLRGNGDKVPFVVFDYAQLMRSEKQDDATNRYEMAVETIKAWTQRMHVHSVIASQVRKTDSSRVRTGESKLDSDSALFLRDDKFNLFMSLNPEYEDYDGESKFTGYATMNVTKNSAGVRGQVTLKARLERLTWQDATDSTAQARIA